MGAKRWWTVVQRTQNTVNFVSAIDHKPMLFETKTDAYLEYLRCYGSVPNLSMTVVVWDGNNYRTLEGEVVRNPYN